MFILLRYYNLTFPMNVRPPFKMLTVHYCTNLLVHIFNGLTIFLLICLVPIAPISPVESLIICNIISIISEIHYMCF